MYLPITSDISSRGCCHFVSIRGVMNSTSFAKGHKNYACQMWTIECSYFSKQSAHLSQVEWTTKLSFKLPCTWQPHSLPADHAYRGGQDSSTVQKEAKKQLNSILIYLRAPHRSYSRPWGILVRRRPTPSCCASIFPDS